MLAQKLKALKDLITQMYALECGEEKPGEEAMAGEPTEDGSIDPMEESEEPQSKIAEALAEGDGMGEERDEFFKRGGKTPTKGRMSATMVIAEKLKPKKKYA